MRFRLAVRLGWSYKKVLTLTAKEFAEWIAYFQLEPWGCEVEDLRMARICQTIAANSLGGHAKPLKEYVIAWDGETETRTGTDLKAKFIAAVQVAGIHRDKPIKDPRWPLRSQNSPS